MVLGNGANGKAEQWVHSPDSLVKGKVNYTVKFIGKVEVPEPKGTPMINAALQKLKFSKLIKQSEGAKPPKVELGISIHCITISDVRTKEVILSISLSRISFCAVDKEDKRLFSFVAKLHDNKYYCYGFDSPHQASDITKTIGQAFDIASKTYLEDIPAMDSTSKNPDMSERVRELEFENNQLRLRLVELEAAQRRAQNVGRAISTQPQVTSRCATSLRSASFDSNGIATPRTNHPRQAVDFLTSQTSRQEPIIDVFNMQPFLPTGSLARLPQPPSRKFTKRRANLSGDRLQKQNGRDGELVNVQNAFDGSFAPTDSDLTLDSFDPLKY